MESTIEDNTQPKRCFFQKEPVKEYLTNFYPDSTRKIPEITEDDMAPFLRIVNGIERSVIEGYDKTSFKVTWSKQYKRIQDLDDFAIFRGLVLFQNDLTPKVLNRVLKDSRKLTVKTMVRSPLIQCLLRNQISDANGIRAFLLFRYTSLDFHAPISLYLFLSILNWGKADRFLIELWGKKLLNSYSLQDFTELPLEIRTTAFKLMCKNHPELITFYFNRWIPKPNLTILYSLLKVYLSRLNNYTANSEPEKDYITYEVREIIDKLLFQNFHLRNEKPFEDLCNFLLSYFISTGNQVEIEPWLKHIYTLRARPSFYFLNKTICYLTQEDNFGLAYSIYEHTAKHFPDLDFRCSISAVNALVESRASTQIVEPLLEEILCRLQAESEAPRKYQKGKNSYNYSSLETSTFSVFMKYALSTRNHKQVSSLIERMKNGKGTLSFASAHVYHMLIREYGIKHKFDLMEEIFEEMTKVRGFLPETKVYYFIIRSYLEKGLTENAQQHLHTMVNLYKLHPTKVIYDLFDQDLIDKKSTRTSFLPP